MRTIEIVPNLITRGKLGSSETVATVKAQGIRRVFSLFPPGEPAMVGWYGYYHRSLSDGAKVDGERIMRIAQLVAEGVLEGDKTLVMCRAGRNRTGLVVCTALHLMLGISGKEALRLFREKRPRGVANPAFEKFLLTLI